MAPLQDWIEPLPDAERMRATDRWAIEEQGVPGVLLLGWLAVAFVAAMRRVPLFPRLLVAIWMTDLAMQLLTAQMVAAAGDLPASVGAALTGLRALYDGLSEAHYAVAGRAAQIVAWVNYITPVPGAQEVISQNADDAEAEGDTETAEYLRTVAESPLVFPTQEMLDRLYSYKVLDEDEERQWNELFQEVVQG